MAFWKKFRGGLPPESVPNCTVEDSFRNSDVIDGAFGWTYVFKCKSKWAKNALLKRGFYSRDYRIIGKMIAMEIKRSGRFLLVTVSAPKKLIFKRNW